MAVEAYVLREARFNGVSVNRPFVLTLFDPDSAEPTGALTAEHPFAPGQSGSLEATGARDGAVWQIRLSRVRITRATPVGCEFEVLGPVEKVSTGEVPSWP